MGHICAFEILDLTVAKGFSVRLNSYWSKIQTADFQKLYIFAPIGEAELQCVSWSSVQSCILAYSRSNTTHRCWSWDISSHCSCLCCSCCLCRGRLLLHLTMTLTDIKHLKLDCIKSVLYNMNQMILTFVFHKDAYPTSAPGPCSHFSVEFRLLIYLCFFALGVVVPGYVHVCLFSLFILEIFFW